MRRRRQARYRGPEAGGVGDFGTYSFFPSKTWAVSAPGLTVTVTTILRRRLVSCGHGGKPKYFIRSWVEISASIRCKPIAWGKLPLLAGYRIVKRTTLHGAEQDRRVARNQQAESVRLPPGGPIPTCPSAARSYCRHTTPQRSHLESIRCGLSLGVVEPARGRAMRFEISRRAGVGSEIYYPPDAFAEVLRRTGPAPGVASFRRLTTEFDIPYSELTPNNGRRDRRDSRFRQKLVKGFD